MGVARIAAKIVRRRAAGRPGVDRRAASLQVRVEGVDSAVGQAGPDAAQVVFARANILLHAVDQRIVQVERVGREGLLVDEAGVLEGLEKVRVALKDVVAQKHRFGAVAIAFALRCDQAIPLAGERVVGDDRLVTRRQADSHGRSQGTAVVHVVGEGLALEKAAVAHQRSCSPADDGPRWS